MVDIPYAFGIPASASSNEYTTCDGPDCRPGKNGANGYPMLDYTKAAVTALYASGVDSDPLFRGTSIWDFGEGVNVNGNAFEPAPAPAEVLLYLWTATDGRKWRTECETAQTGRNGCRSWVEATVIESTDSGYRSVKKFVFNNIVRFSR